jgi:hypothetical protein
MTSSHRGTNVCNELTPQVSDMGNKIVAYNMTRNDQRFPTQDNKTVEFGTPSATATQHVLSSLFTVSIILNEDLRIHSDQWDTLGITDSRAVPTARGRSFSGTQIGGG